MNKSGPTAAIAAIFLTFIGVMPLQPAGAAELGTAAEPVARPSVQRAWQTIEDLASSSNPQHRKYSAAAFALLAQKHGRALESVKSLLQSDHEAEVRTFTAAALGQERVRAAIPALREALDDPAAPVAFAAAKALWDMRDRSGAIVFQEVLTGARKNSEGLVNSYLSDARHKMRDPKGLAMMGVKEATSAFFGPAGMAISFAQESMKDKGAAGRAYAATALADDRSTKSREILESALQDSSPLVRAAACRSLAILNDRRSRVFVEPLLDDKDDGARALASAAYIRLNEPARARKPSR
jgi:HEAT repeat protein